jgi:hypothetical protein
LLRYLEQPCGRAVAGADADAAAEAQDESSGVGDYSAGETAEGDEVGNSEGGKAVDVVVAAAVACAVVVAAAVLVPAGTADTGEVVEGGRRRTGRYMWLALSVRKREGDCF